MPTLLIYGIVALGILGALGGVTYKVHHHGYEEGIAELTPKLNSCKAEKTALEGTLATQERAVQALKAEGEAKVAKATEGLRRATTASLAARSEAERLRGLAKGAAAATACPAGSAVEEVRKGLSSGAR